MEELIQALNKIKEECADHPSCKNCPISDQQGHCGISSIRPDNWNITEPYTVTKIVK